MKYRTTKKAILQGYKKVISIGYCDAHYMLFGLEPIAYTCGNDGWHADIYQIDSQTAIVTGYQPFGNFKPAYDVVEAFNSQAKLLSNIDDYETRKREAHKILTAFIEEVTR